MNKIYLVTNQFPYSFSEQFLETEIEFWDKSELVIVPTRIANKVRDVNGICIRTSVAKKIGPYNKLDWSHLFKTLFSSYFFKELIRTPKILFSAAKLKSLFRFEYLTQRYYSAIKNDFTREELKDALFYTYWFSWGTCALTRLSKEYDFKIITRCHRVDLYAYAQPCGYMPYAKSYYKNIDTIYSISQDGIDYLHETFDIELSKLKIARLGVPSRYENKLSYDNSIQKIHILSVSYVKPVKRVLLIAEMLNKYALENPSLKLTWTHFGDGPEFEQLKAAVVGASITVNLMGMRNNIDVINYYKSEHINAFINLSLSEGVPVSIMEAISFGVSVVATDCGGTKEIVNDNVGKLINVDFEYQDFSAALKDALVISAREIQAQFKEQYCAEVNYPLFKEELRSHFNKG